MEAAHHIRISILGAIFAVSLVGADAAAQEPTHFVSGEAGYGQIAEDGYVTLRVDYVFRTDLPAAGCDEPPCRSPFGLALQAPVRLRAVDRDPADGGVVREDDWDEPSDFLRILRHIEYGRPDQPVHARVGELGPLVLGHGTLMNGYFNVVTTDLHQSGVHANLNTRYGGLQLVLDNVIAPSVFGMRGYVRPWGAFGTGSWWERLAVGVSAVTDVDAPTRLEPDVATGLASVEPGSTPPVSESSPVTLAGVDLELAVLDRPDLTLLPYADLNVGSGTGFHGGVAASKAFGDSVSVSVRGEFRWAGPGYLPDYFGPLYEIDRYQYPGWGVRLPAPKARVAASRTGQATGGYGEVSAELFDVVSLSTSLADHEGPRNTAYWLRLHVTPPIPLQLGAVYYKQAFDGAGALFDLDGALVVAEARATVWGPIFVHGAYNHLWRLHGDGRYETIHTWNAGAGAQLAW